MAATDASNDAIVGVARAWIAADPDEETRAELASILERAERGDGAAVADLHDRFDSRLEFGTAGLRGVLGAGPNRMNRLVVAQTSAGLARFLLSRDGEQHVVIGYDGRKNSAVFARDAAEVLAGAGARVTLLPRLLPTPVLAFAVRHLDASAGIMITASHNPARDNGYKLYLGGDSEGSQIVPPADARVFEAITAVVDEGVEIPRSRDYGTADESLIEAYIAETAAAFALPDVDLPWVYTPMHGVGWETFSRVLTAADAPVPALVTEQVEPDPEFPTVAFPNPEEEGALDLAYATARETGAEVIIANDPDADRLAVAIRRAPGEWEQLRGNEVGLLLAWSAAERAAHAGRKGTLASSIVSTPGLGVIAKAYGLGYTETLTGFKWISRVPDLLFGFEEALGYLVDPGKVRDKDGISAALAALQIVLEQRVKGVGFDRYRASFVEKFGWFGSDQISIRVSDLSEIDDVMRRLRTHPPASIGAIPVDRVDDLRNGSAEFPPSDVLRLILADGARVIVRPSGTEPKLKVYLDVSVTDGPAAGRPARGAALLTTLTEGMRELL